MKKWLTLPFALLLVLSLASVTLAHARDTQTNLEPDPYAYCSKNPPDQLQVQENQWQVAFQQLVGTQNQNDWKCRYQVVATVPIAAGDNAGFMPLPPATDDEPVNWDAMCNQQYPGAHAQWLPGPETNMEGAPWECAGQPGVVYDPAEQVDGTHQILSQ